MNRLYRSRVQGLALPGMLLILLMAGCEGADQAGDAVGSQAPVDQSAVDAQPLGQVAEFDDYTLRANVPRTEVLPDAMARKYDIQPAANLALLNLVVLDKRSGQQPAAVEAEVAVRYEGLVGHAEVVDMRAIEEDGYVSYLGTLDASSQRVFRLTIEAQPRGTNEQLQMSFEVQLDTLDRD